jgi:hypothetical protein
LVDAAPGKVEELAQRQAAWEVVASIAALASRSPAARSVFEVEGGLVDGFELDRLEGPKVARA